MLARLRQRRERLALVLGALALLAPGSLDASEPAPETLERVGPLQVSSSGRDTVRGGRPDGATIHETHVS